ncbi:hypothetical protein [Chenggangzhangella methanolivorans]|uniref:Uncharacterized protein n=1 Tax=Chenggangzhangella methanolivorans TaxID=1437009 RepID=A0A9E6R5G6_9HYPH|nr:hypothetical protein [Chenggangzhangella methanolivorans]QZN98570.1 hypothetical protein K6K41_16175 [Chenggangzhangella methanolivorans]
MARLRGGRPLSLVRTGLADPVARRAFDNFAEFEALYGATADVIAERDEPRAMSSRQVPAAIRDRIALAAGEALAQAA